MKLLNSRKLSTRLILVILSFCIVMVSEVFIADHYSLLNGKISDRLISIRGHLSGVNTDKPLVPILIDSNFYFNRGQHAEIIKRLSELNVSVQLLDFIFKGEVDTNEDIILTQAIEEAANVHLGISFESLEQAIVKNNKTESYKGPYNQLKQDWPLVINGNPQPLFIGINPEVNFSAITSAAKNIGFLNVKSDKDGILRRVPLIARYQEKVYPSIILSVVSQYFGTSPNHIRVNPGKHIILQTSKASVSTAQKEIRIPIDKHGNMILHNTDLGDVFNHYSYSEIQQLSSNDKSAKFTGKIAILSENVSNDIRVRSSNKNDYNQLTSGTLYAIVIQNILSEDFIAELSYESMQFIGAFLLLLVLLFSLYGSSITLFFGSLAILFTYISSGTLLFAYADVMFKFVQPLIMVALASMFIYIAIVIEKAVLFSRTEKAKRLAERELEIGRNIQSGFFPSTMPIANGWQVASFFKAARHVAGDFYDAFHIGKKRYVGIVVADICDKGVGAALYMAIFRSLIRVLSGASDDNGQYQDHYSKIGPKKILKETVESINNYISVTHEKDAMFATIFFGIVDTENGRLYYINGGHEPPVIVGSDGVRRSLNPTGPAVGAYPNQTFRVENVVLKPGEILFGYTDGVTDARNQSGDTFSKERLYKELSSLPNTPQQLIDRVIERLADFTQDKEQFDDITLMTVGRNIL